jgi:hypothetical protein
MDYEVQRCTRRCATTGREFVPGDEFFSALIPQGAEVVRQDFSPDAWQGPPERAIGWWKSKVPTPQSERARWAPSDVRLHYFDELAAQPEKQDVRYLLALLLVRSRVLRHEETQTDDQGRQVLVLYCPRRETTYHVVETVPDETRANEIQEELVRLLFAG